MSVFLRQQKLKKGIYLSLVESFYSKEKGNTYQKTIEKLGYLDELKKIYTDPIKYYKDIASNLSIESQEKYKQSNIEKIPRSKTIKNIGYFMIKRLYDLFKLEDEFTFLSTGRKYRYDIESIFRFLLYSQIIIPGSKISEYQNRDLFFEDFNFSDDQMYDAINEIGINSKYILEHIIYELKEFYKPSFSHTYFDCTNIYFEIDKENDFQKRGPEKNNRHDPIIGLGLLMDSNGIPISYSLFPGNESEQPEMHKNANLMKKNLNIKGKTILVADKGLNSGDNMIKAIENGDGYVVGQKVRGASKETLSWILCDDGYKETLDEFGNVVFKIKDEVDNYKINVTSRLSNEKTQAIVRQKRVVFYSKDYKEKSAYEREKLIVKAHNLINNPSEYKKQSIGDASTYIKEIKYDKDGNIITTSLEMDYDRIEKEKMLDGYYMIVTSETNLSSDEIIKIYRGLWEIEESFSIVKGVLKVRPVFHKTKNGIESHMLICFFSLLILRLLQKTILKDELTDEQKRLIAQANKRRKKNKIRIEKVGELSMKKIVNFMRDYEAQKINDSYYIGKYNPDINVFEKAYDLILDRHRLSQKDIEKFFKN